MTNAIRHEFYQNDDYIILTVFAKKCSQDDIKLELQPTSLSLHLTDRDYTLQLEPLSHEIVPDGSSLQVFGTKVEIKLKKAQSGVKWNVLEGEDSIVQMSRPSYPTSSKKAVDWDKIQAEDDKKDDINALFQKIYSEGSEDVKKAMMKSFQESGGTTLSTNWDDIKKEKTPIRPPDGVEVKEFK